MHRGPHGQRGEAERHDQGGGDAGSEQAEMRGRAAPVVPADQRHRAGRHQVEHAAEQAGDRHQPAEVAGPAGREPPADLLRSGRDRAVAVGRAGLDERGRVVVAVEPLPDDQWPDRAVEVLDRLDDALAEQVRLAWSGQAQTRAGRHGADLHALAEHRDARLRGDRQGERHRGQRDGQHECQPTGPDRRSSPAPVREAHTPRVTSLPECRALETATPPRRESHDGAGLLRRASPRPWSGRLREAHAPRIPCSGGARRGCGST